MSNLVKGRGQRLIPEYLLKYLENQKENGVNITQLVDANGNPRFIEGVGVPAEITGFTPTYYKWSLSGTHLMFVLAGNFVNGARVENRTNIVNFTLPEFILNKITPTASNVIEIKSIDVYADDMTYQSFRFKLIKSSETQSMYFETGSFSANNNRGFRIQFDLLIDSD